MKKEYHYECPEDLKEAKLCGRYFSEAFNKVRTTFTHYNKYIDQIKSIEDPILRHVALYLVDNFEDYKKYLSEDATRKNNIDCEVLNRWLDQRKSFYTYGSKCQGNLKLWNETIEKLWDTLNEKQEDNKYCERQELYAGNAYIPEQFLPLTCYKYVPEKHDCTPPLDIFRINPLALSRNCNAINKQCSKCKKKNHLSEYIPSEEYTFPVTYPYNGNYNAYSSPERQISCRECPSKIIIIPLSICITFFGTLFILYLLYKFTPLGAKLSNVDREKEKLWQQLIEEEEEEEDGEYEVYERFRNNNPYSREERSSLHYQ